MIVVEVSDVGRAIAVGLGRWAIQNIVSNRGDDEASIRVGKPQ